MKECKGCGNVYDKPLKIQWQGEEHFFDSFQCAIHVLAPTCQHCHIKIIGHGVESDGSMFCCAHCAGEEGVLEIRDRVDHSRTSQSAAL